MLTNFAVLTDEQKTAWSMKFWRYMRNRSFLSKFTGDGEHACIQRIKELTKTEKGARAVLTLIADSLGDGVAGDAQLEGNEEAMLSEDIVIQIDQLRHAHVHEGKMAEQRSIVRFRKEALDNLTYWITDRYDQQAFLALSGISFSQNTNGSPRIGSQFSRLDYAADVTPPTANRLFVYDNDVLISAKNGGANNVDTLTTLSYRMLVALKAQAEFVKMRPIRMDNGISYYHVFAHPLAMADLKLDQDYLTNVRHAAPRSMMNELFKGTDTIMLDGLAITPFHHVYNTTGAAAGSKYGATGTVEGQRLLFCGAQALGYADIGAPDWEEKMFDYNNRPGIAVGKICGFKKPVFTDPTTGTLEDFGVMVVDTRLNSGGAA